jgi:hypothetical protein
MRRIVRLTAVGAVLAATALSGLVIGPMPSPVRAALAALGVNDTLTMKHDRTAIVPAPGVLGNDVNIPGGATAILVSGVTHGALSLRSDGGYTYMPGSGYVGADSFRYRPSGLLSTAATVTITITNATPVAKPDAYSFAGAALVVAAPGVLANDTDADGDALTAERVGGITGSLNLDPDGGFQYTPGGGFSGSATFSYRVWDGVAWSGTTTVTLTRPAPSPTPVPTPSPTPTPPPAVTPVPVPTIPLPIPSLPIPSLPIATPVASPLPSILLPIGVTPSASPSATESPRPAGQEPSGTASPGVGGGASGPGLHLKSPPPDLGVGKIGILAGLETWAVPAAVMGGPGLLVLLWIALQGLGATIWVPAARRLKDGGASERGGGRVRA